MTFFTNTDEFLAKFGTLSDEGFFDPIHLTDTKVGFSIKRNYPTNIRYRPAIGQKSGNPDNIAAIWIVYTHPEEARRPFNETHVPLRIRIANTSIYRTRHSDYDYDDVEGDCPSKESVEASEATPKPKELEYSGEYFFDHIRDSFLDANRNTVAGVDILNRVFRDHCDTVHLLRGLSLRTRLLAQDGFAGFLRVIALGLEWLLKNLFGRTLEDSEMLAGVFEPYKPEAMKKLDADSLVILGYKAARRVVIVFCLVLVVASLYRYVTGADDDYWKYVAASEFLLFVHALLFIWILDAVVPWLLFWAINRIIWLRTTVILMKIRGP